MITLQNTTLYFEKVEFKFPFDTEITTTIYILIVQNAVKEKTYKVILQKEIHITKNYLFSGAGGQTQGFGHVRQAFYYRTMPPGPQISLFIVENIFIKIRSTYYN